MLPAARLSTQSPSKALVGLPEQPELSGTPTMRSRFWTVDASAADVYAWLGRHDAGLGPEGTVGSVSSGDTPVDPSWALAQYRTYASPPPPGIAVGHLYVGVAAIDAGRSAVAAYAVTLEQPSRPDSEVVPTTGVRAVIGWELAPGGTPARKLVTGGAAAQLARDFNALRVSSKDDVACPLIPQGNGTQVTVTFSAGGHTWVASIPVCPSIAVTRDGRQLPALDFGQPFLRDVKAYAGHLPWDGALAGGGQVTPMGGGPVPPTVR